MGQVASRIKSVFTPSDHTDVSSETKGLSEGASSYKAKSSFIFQSADEIKTNFPTPRKPLKRSLSQIVDYALPQSFTDIFKPKRMRLDLTVESKKSDDKFLDFPFLEDRRTINYFKNSKVMFILRGLPGSGKSTIIDALSRIYNTTEKCSADDFFMIDGKYVYEFEKIGEAHRHCQLNAVDAVQRQVNMIAIDNTNVQFWEMKFYLDLAAEYNYLPVIVEPKTPWKMDPQILEEKNTHAINRKIIELKLASFKDHLPLYCGWFINERDSFLIRDQALWWLKEGYKHQTFVQDCSYYYGVNSFDELEYLYPQLHSCSLLHCTTKYIGRGKVEDTEEYLENTDVQDALHRIFDLEIFGYIFTPRTVGARVRLQQEEIILWAGNDIEDIPDYFYVDKAEQEMAVEEETASNGEDSVSIKIVNVESVDKSSINSDDCDSSNKVADLSTVTNGDSLLNGTNIVKVGENDLMEVELVDSVKNGKLPLNGVENGESPLNGVENGELPMFGVENGDSPVEAVKSDESLMNGTKNGESPQNCALSSVNGDFDNGVTTESTDDDVQKSAVTTAPRKTPRKRKTKGVEIPQNERFGSDSSTSSFIRFEASESDKFDEDRGRRAHLTLGCVDGILPVTTGLDTLFCAYLEQDSTVVTSEKRFNTEGGMCKSFGNGVWIVYPKEKIIVSSVFAKHG